MNFWSGTRPFVSLRQAEKHALQSDSDSGLQPYCLWQDITNIRQVYGKSRNMTGKYAFAVSLAIVFCCYAQFMRRRLKVRRYSYLVSSDQRNDHRTVTAIVQGDSIRKSAKVPVDKK